MLAAAWMLGGCYVSAPADAEGANGTRLRRIVMRPDSGDPIFAGWHDSELDADCRFMRATDGMLRCLPLQRQAAPYYLDADCTERVISALEPCAEAQLGYGFGTPSACGEEPVGIEVFAVEAEELSVDRVYQLRAGACVALDGALTHVRRLTRVDPTRFVAAEVIRGEGTGALARDRLLAEDGATQPWTLRDLARDESCSAAGVGVVERTPCVTTGALDVLSGGERCDQRWAWSYSSGCSPPELAVEVERDACGDPVGFGVYTVEEPVPEAERVYGEGCAAPLAIDDVYRTRRADDAVPWLTGEWRGAGRLQVRSWTDEAGNVLSSGAPYWDRELGFACDPKGTADGIRCVPGPIFSSRIASVGGDLFADAACTSIAAARWPVGCDPEIAYLREPLEGCAGALQLTAVYRVGEPIDAVYRVHPVTGECGLDEGAGGGYALEPIPLESLARVERVVE